MTRKILLKSLLFLPALLLLFSCGQSDKVTIKGKVSGISDGTEIRLLPGATHSNESPIATTTITNGEFSMTTEAPGPRMFYLQVDGHTGIIKFMAENGDDVYITAESKEGRGGNMFSSTSITGSSIHEEYLKKVAPREQLNEMHLKYNEENKEVSAKMSAARRAGDQKLQQEIAQSEEWKKLEREEREFFNTVETTYSGLFLSNADSWWGPLLMLDVMSYFTEEQREPFENFSQEAKDSYYGQILRNELYPVGLVGDRYPSFVLTDDSGKNVDVQALITGKKYILIDFWASWCAPCRREIPNLKKLYETYSSKGFEIISISIDRKEDDWRKALEEEQLKWPNFLDTNGAQNVWGVRTIPAMFLLDGSGKIVSENIRGESLADKLKELLGN